MKLYQIMRYNKNREYGDDYVACVSHNGDSSMIFFSEDAAKAYCEEQNLTRAKADREQRYQLALANHNRMVVHAREHNALVDAGVREGPKTSAPANSPDPDDFPIDGFLSKRWPEFTYEELNSMDEPVS